eukprot:TRINITY_DN3331_c0_g3_i1.p1 TRINITY_DN3331_c0_g3~~TRINITY_DN3331_c0_g3_i1.p1  ORF type:complete len:454 (-),score=98.88 TRINITY_DN3331_c0_g3_i1:313-1674(-)
MSEPKARPLGATELSWCRAVPGGTGITVLSLLLSRRPDPSLLQNALRKLQLHHPILRSTLSSSSISISSSPSMRLQSLDPPSNLLQTPLPFSSFHLLLEHELNQNPWSQFEEEEEEDDDDAQFDVFFATLYSLPDSKHVLSLRLHTSICDRTAAVALSRELLGLMREGVGGEKWVSGDVGGEEMFLPIEEMVPKGKGDKPFWSRGVDLMGYSLNSMRISNLGFGDVGVERASEVVRMQMSREETDRILAGCREREIKLCGALTAAGLIAANSKNIANNWSGNYTVVTMTDCRKYLDPVLQENCLGFYFSGILNTHSITKGEELWDVAKRCHMALSNAINSNKHFTDMGDLNFLMCKAIDNPGLTPSSSQRTAFMTMFEDTVIDDSSYSHEEVGLEDYIGCSSIHGVGPSVAVFDTVRNGRLDCTFVYPSPLHSRKQMQELIDDMKDILLRGGD